jgi:hypothetical protein
MGSGCSDVHLQSFGCDVRTSSQGPAPGFRRRRRDFRHIVRLFLRGRGGEQWHAGGVQYQAATRHCSGPLNREHFVSKVLLQDFAKDGGLQVRGYPHGNDAGELLMSVESMSTKVLCESHNRRLSKVDVEGSRFLLAFFSAHVGLLEEKFTSDQTYECDGPLIERWMLKYLCGLISSGQAGIGVNRIATTSPPLEFLQVLFGLDTLPDEWGLYTRPTSPIGVSDRKSLSLAPYLPLQPTGRYHVSGAKIEHYGFISILALKTPQKPFTRSDLEGSIHHPEFFKFSYEPTGRSVVLVVNWPSQKTGTGFAINLHKGAPPTIPAQAPGQ